jgi:hypothetical protein
MWLINYFVAFFLTIIVESLVAVSFGFRSREALLAVVCVNVITHPLLVYLLWLNIFIGSALLSIPFLEILVVIVEWRLLVYALVKNSKKLLIMSAVMNAASYTTGRLLL